MCRYRCPFGQAPKITRPDDIYPRRKNKINTLQIGNATKNVDKGTTRILAGENTTYSAQAQGVYYNGTLCSYMSICMIRIYMGQVSVWNFPTRLNFKRTAVFSVDV